MSCGALIMNVRRRVMTGHEAHRISLPMARAAAALADRFEFCDFDANRSRNRERILAILRFEINAM